MKLLNIKIKNNVCRICFKMKSIIGIQHLRTHNYTVEQYLKEFNLVKSDLIDKDYTQKVSQGLKRSYIGKPKKIKSEAHRKRLSETAIIRNAKFGNPMKDKKRPDLTAYNKIRKESFYKTEEYKRKISPLGRKHSEETKKKMSLNMKGHKWSEESKKAYGYKLSSLGMRKGNKNGRFGKPMSIMGKEKSSAKAIKRFWKNVGIKGYLESIKFNKDIPFRSSLEKKFIEFCENNVFIASLAYETYSIRYIFENCYHNTVPDFEVIDIFNRKFIIEIKGSHLFNRTKEQVKMKAVKDYCDKNGIIYKVLTEKELQNESEIEEIFRKKISLRFAECAN